jgi:hypothetical protein
VRWSCRRNLKQMHQGVVAGVGAVRRLGAAVAIAGLVYRATSFAFYRLGEHGSLLAETPTNT